MSFDPDAYLATPAARPAFDPDHYLSGGFNPDEWLRQQEGRSKFGPGNVGHMFAQGALDQGVGSTAEGAVRIASTTRRRSEEVAAYGPEYQRVSQALNELQQAEMAGFPGTEARATETARLRARLAEIESEQAPAIAAIRARPQPYKKAIDAVGELRAAVREVYPVDEDVRRSVPGQVVAGIGQALGGMPAYMTGLGLPASAAQMFDQGFSDAKENGADDEIAVKAGLANMPAALLEQLGDRLQVGVLVKVLREGGRGAKAVGKAVVNAAAGEGATEYAQQVHQNATARELYAKDRKLTEGAAEAALVGGLTGAAVAGGAGATGEALRRSPPAEPAEKTPKQPKTDEEFSRAAQQAKQPIAGTSDLESAIGQSLPDAESRDVLTGRSAEASARALKNVQVDFGKTVESVKDALLAGSATPAQLDALDFQLRVLEERAGKRGRMKPDQVNASLSNTFLIEALPAAEVFPLVSRLAEDSANIAALRSGIAAMRGQAPQTTTAPTPTTGALTPEDRAAKIAELRAKDQQAAEEKQRATAAQEQQRIAAETAEKEKTARVRAENRRLRAIELTGRDPDTQQIVDLSRVPDDEIDTFDPEAEGISEKQLEAEMERRARAAERAQAEQTSRGEELLEVLRRVQLPLKDAALGEELRKLLFEEMPLALRKRLASPDAGTLDGVAEALRERGFAWAQTPADVIDAVQRALRGEKIYAERGGDIDREAAQFARRRSFAVADVDPAGALPQVPAREGKETAPGAGQPAAATVSGTAGGRADLPAPPQPRAEVAETATPEGAAGGPGRRIEGRLTEKHGDIETRVFGPTEANPANLRAEPVPAIEAKLERGAIERDRAARAVNAFIDDEGGKAPHWSRQRWTKKGGEPFVARFTREEAEALARAIRAFDKGERFVWPNDELRERVMTNFARRRPDPVRPEGERNAARERWWENFRLIAPGAARDFELKFGSSTDLVAEGNANADELTGDEEAASLRQRQEAYRGAIYLFDQALRQNGDHVTLLNLLHELGHLFYDTLDASTKATLHDQWRAEIDGKTGPLFADGQLRENVALGVGENIHEWFAERLAHANDAWAQRRTGNAAKGDTLINTIAAEFRALLTRLREYLERAFGRERYGDALVRDFRKFLDQGDRWADPVPDPDGELAGAFAKTGLPEFARREQTPEPAKVADLLRDFASLERTRDRYLADGNQVPRHVLTGLADLREQLDNADPKWRDKLNQLPPPSAPAATEATPPEAGATALFTDPEGEVSPEATAAKRSQLEASALTRPSGLKQWLENLGRIFTNFKSAIPELPNGAGGRVFARFRQGYRMMKAATDYVRKDAEERVAHVLEPLTGLGRTAIAPARYRELQELQRTRAKQIEAGQPVRAGLTQRIAAIEQELENVPYHLFRKVVLYRDLFFRSRLAGPAGDPLSLPFGLTQKEIETTLRELHTRLAQAPHQAQIEEALRRHYALVKTVRDGLLERGYIIPEELRNPVYFPHLLIDKTSGGLQRVKLDTAEDFRGYLQQLVGSAKAINTDYLTAMYHHLATVEAHNARQDIVEQYWQPYDIKKKLETEARRHTAERREQGLGPIHWRALVPKDHVVMTVDDRIPVRPEYIINRQVLADRLGVALGEGDLQQQLRELGLSVTLTAEDFQAALAAGEKQQWVVPKPIAEAMRGIIARDTRTVGVAHAVISAPNSLWKRWTLFAPHTTIRYNYGNLVSDLEKLFSADPAVFRQLRPAFAEVRAFYSGAEPGEDLREAFRRGVIDGVTAGEVTDLAAQQLDRFDAFLSSPEKFMGMMKRGLGWGVTVSRVREAAFRYAKFKADLERMRAGRDPVFAGAFNRDVRAIEEPTPEATRYAQAAEIARKTFGDYSDISVSGDALRKYLIPFYSWTEVNFRYHVNLFRNLGDMTAGAGAAQIARQGAAAASRVLIARSVTGVLLRLALPYVAVAMWNSTGDREELEKTLSDEDRRRFHIIVGKDEQGRTRVIYAPTALTDFMRWFGGNQFAMLAGKYGRGEINLPQLVHEWVTTVPPDVFNNAVQGVGPVFKMVWTALARKNPFPDVLNQRSVPDHDLAAAVLGNMVDGYSADLLRTLLDKDYYTSRTQGDWARQLVLQTRLRDPEQWGYYATMDRVAAYQAAHGGTVDFGVNNRADAQILSSFRRAIRAGDVKASLAFYQKLLAAGYTAERFAASVRNADPLATLKKEYRSEFVNGLAPAERFDLSNAYKYAARLKAFQRRERTLFPSDHATPGYRQRFAEQGGRPDVFAGIMADFANEPDEALNLKAETLLKQSLRKR